MGDDIARTEADHVDDDIAFHVLHDGAVGNREGDVITRRTISPATVTLTTVCRAAVRCVVVIKERGGVAINDEDDIASAATRATIGTAEGLELFTVYGDATIAAIAT